MEASRKPIIRQTDDSVDKKTICHLIGHITNLNKIVEEIKKDTSNTQELASGIKKIDEGISDIKFYIANSLSTQTVKKEIKTQMNPLNLPKITMAKVPTIDNPLSPRPKSPIKNPIKISPRLNTSFTENSATIKRRNTDYAIRYRK